MSQREVRVLRPLWNRLKGEDNKNKEDNGIIKTVKSGLTALKKIIAKIFTKVLLKFLPYILIATVGIGAVSWALDVLINGKNNPEYVYETIGKEDLNELIAVAGNEEDGYYIAYKEGLDEKLDEIVDKYKEGGYYYINKDIL